MLKSIRQKKFSKSVTIPLFSIEWIRKQEKHPFSSILCVSFSSYVLEVTLYLGNCVNGKFFGKDRNFIFNFSFST